MGRSPAPALRIPLESARVHWHHRQGLAEPLKGSLEEVVAATGWVRTLGGVDVYLALRGRVPGLRRQELDKAVQASRLQVVPAVRGCIYLVPRADVPLALRVAQEQERKRTEREMEKVGVTTEELEQVGHAVLAALRKGPLTPDALRKALPAGTVRSLGEKGKKVGLSSPLPPALRRLEFAGLVERTLEDGRLDSERYQWRLVARSPFAGARVPDSPVERQALLARRFFHQAGPARLEDFTTWAGLSQRDARAAMAQVPLVPLAVEGWADEAFALEEDLAALREPGPAATSVSLLSAEDNYLVDHGGPAPLCEARHHALEIPVWGNTKGSTLGDARHMLGRALLEGERLAGMWEYDPDEKSVVFTTFAPLSAARRKAVKALAEETTAFLRDDMGHACIFSLDTEEAMRERVAALKAWQTR